jgi:hypothetical protein
MQSLLASALIIEQRLKDQWPFLAGLAGSLEAEPELPELDGV